MYVKNTSAKRLAVEGMVMRPGEVVAEPPRAEAMLKHDDVIEVGEDEYALWRAESSKPKVRFKQETKDEEGVPVAQEAGTEEVTPKEVKEE